MTAEEEIVTILKNLDAKVDAIQKSQATLRPDIIEQILDILKQRWKDEAPDGEKGPGSNGFQEDR